MAKLEMGILGGFSGRVGTVVGYHRRGAWFVRAYQPHIKDRKSAAQLEQRSRFKAMIQFASPATPVLRVGLRRVAADWQITEGNAFLKINKECFPRESRNSRNTRESRNSRAIDYPSLQFSQGSLAAPAALHCGRGRYIDGAVVGQGRTAHGPHTYLYILPGGHGRYRPAGRARTARIASAFATGLCQCRPAPVGLRRGGEGRGVGDGLCRTRFHGMAGRCRCRAVPG